MIQYTIKKNGDTICKAVVDESDLLEVALAKLAGDDISMLNVSAMISSGQESGSNSIWETSRVDIGDEITISTENLPIDSPANIIGELEDEFGDSAIESSETGLICSFCGKSQYEVSEIIAGENATICKECIEMCCSIYKT